MNIWYLHAPQRWKVTTASASDIAQKEEARWVIILTAVTALVLVVPWLWSDTATETLTFWSLWAGTFIPWKINKITTITWWTVAVAY